MSFSASTGDKNISIDKRIDIANELLDLNSAKKKCENAISLFFKTQIGES